MSFLRIGHSPALAARLSETHERIFFLARSEPTAQRREKEEEPSCEAIDTEERSRG